MPVKVLSRPGHLHSGNWTWSCDHLSTFTLRFVWSTLLWLLEEATHIFTATNGTKLTNVLMVGPRQQEALRLDPPRLLLALVSGL